MSTEKLPIITISREYYAGGTTIAKALSSELGIPWYEQDISKLASKISGYTEEEINQEGEEISSLDSFLDKMLNGLVSYKSSHDEIFNAQKEAVMELATEPCIIVGRCAGPMLRDAGINSFDIFLHADEEVRLKRCVESLNITEAEAKKIVEKRDSFRKLYFNKYTGREYTDLHNYSLTIDTGIIDYHKAIKMIARVIETV